MNKSKHRTFDEHSLDLGNRSILITGGTGSFGRAMVVRLLASNPPRRLIVFSRDEQKQESMAREIAAAFPDLSKNMRYFIGDVRDMSRLEMAMRDVDVVIHAAALKIVPTAEYNPFECVLTNIYGTENVVKAALRAGVKKIIALSTDKAANPINLYGATKLAADKIIVAANNLVGNRETRYSVVRYGNVIGSRGSVVPLFERMIREGAKTLPITDPRMTRFWITLEQGVSFVLSSLGIMRGGEIFVPKIPSMRLTDLALTLAPDLPHETVGIRPGEKLHEVLLTDSDSRSTLELDDRYVVCPPLRDWDPAPLMHIGARQVEEGFQYSSETNTEWLDGQALTGLLSRKSP